MRLSFGSNSESSKASFRSILKLLWWEGAAFSAYDAWLGPTYTSGLAGELGIGVGLVALVTSVPWLGQIGQFLGCWAVDRTRSFKRYTIAVATAARALWLIPLFLAAFYSYRTAHGGPAFPVYEWFFLLSICACFSSLLSCSSGTAWMSWMKGIIPEHYEGRFFGGKQRYNMAVVVFANLLAAILVSWQPRGYRLGLAVLGVLALAATSISLVLLTRVPDAPPRPEGPRRSVLAFMAEPLRDAPFRRFLVFVAIFWGTILLSGPYFPYYFTRELHIPMSSVALWLMLSNLGSFFAASRWGRKVDRDGPLSVLRFAGPIICISPLIYTIPSASIISRVAPFEYFINGMGWAGYNIAIQAMLFSIAPREKNAAYFSVYSAALGTTGALCVYLGGQLSHWFIPWGGFRLLWVVSTVARLTALWGVGYLLLRHTNASAPNQPSMEPVSVV